MSRTGRPLPWTALAWLLAGLSLAVAPHLLRVPLWVVAAFVLLGVWRAMAGLGRWPLPDRRHRLLRWTKQSLAVVTFLAVLATFGGELGRAAGVALLVVLVGLKLLEMRGERDFYLVATLGYFLVVTDFLYDQSIFTAVYLFATVLVLTACLITYNDRAGHMPLRPRLELAVRLLLQAVPLMLVLFVLFPRLPGPLWGVPRDAGAALSGLSDEMTPGSISQLGLSDEVAFRVEFDGEVPEPGALYWRGPVFWHTDGRTWTRGSGGDLRPVPVYTRGQGVRYSVTLEPHGERWLFALEMPSNTPPIARITRDFRFLARHRINRRVRYSAISHTDYRVADAAQGELERALALPEGAHPRSVELGRRWARELDEPRAIVERALAHFNEQPFYYTLTPPATPGDVVDTFLFQTREGFCEHYAAAFAVLMRAAGLPTRVVTGYQGGEYNPVGDYLAVRQRDAHAWTEVWLGQQRGWVRVDPTGAVAPERVESGIDQVLARTGRSLPLGLERNPTLQRMLKRTRDLWDAANNAWNQWVLGYGPSRQNQLLSRFGMSNPGVVELGLWLAASVAVLLAGIAAWVLIERRPGGDPARRAYDRFCARLARAGVVRAPSEGPLDFAARARAARGDLAAAIDRITGLYVAARYGEREEARAALVQAVRALRV